MKRIQWKSILLFSSVNLLFNTILVLFSLGLPQISAQGCYFPPEYEGSYITQWGKTNGETQYKEINITVESMQVWGDCYKRIGNNFILVMFQDEETRCFLCFNLKLVSRNILRAISTNSNMSKCNTNEEKAIASCPLETIIEQQEKNERNDNSVLFREHYTEIKFYKQFDKEGQEVPREYCPVNGRYEINYKRYDSKEKFIECSTSNSELDNCPSSSTINLRFRGCSFEDHDICFQCLGTWKGIRNETYLILKNLYFKRKLGPQYRCAIYSGNDETGEINLTFRKDSTCSIENRLSSDNKIDQLPFYESLKLLPKPLKSSSYEDRFCRYPDWLQGYWQHTTIKNDTLIFYEPTTFKVYTMKCLEKLENDIFTVFSRTQCGEEYYICLRIVQRDINIYEFQMDSKVLYNYYFGMCSVKIDGYKFSAENEPWFTQVRVDKNLMHSTCPVDGIFEGMIPDAETSLAKLSSECTLKDIMHYVIFDLENNKTLEERTYKCLGYWKQNNDAYIYTKRIDTNAYECFAATAKSNMQFIIREAGQHCEKNPILLRKYGMQMEKVGFCKNSTVTDLYLPTLERNKDIFASNDGNNLNQFPEYYDSSVKLSNGDKNNYVSADNSFSISNPNISETNDTKNEKEIRIISPNVTDYNTNKNALPIKTTKDIIDIADRKANVSAANVSATSPVTTSTSVFTIHSTEKALSKRNHTMTVETTITTSLHTNKITISSGISLIPSKVNVHYFCQLLFIIINNYFIY